VLEGREWKGIKAEGIFLILNFSVFIGRAKRSQSWKWRNNVIKENLVIRQGKNLIFIFRYLRVKNITQFSLFFFFVLQLTRWKIYYKNSMTQRWSGINCKASDKTASLSLR
jgi:hypothetical protein